MLNQLIQQKINTWQNTYKLTGLEMEYIQNVCDLTLKWQPLPSLISNVSWNGKMPLHHIHDIQRKTLSGPVQEDKADVYDIIVKLIDMETKSYNTIDLTLINGICEYIQKNDTFVLNIEELIQNKIINNKILSLQDFQKAKDKLKDMFDTFRLTKAEWFGDRYYLQGNLQDVYHMVALIVYAKRRRLTLEGPASIKTYKLNSNTLNTLSSKYQVLNIPHEAWQDKLFMSFLLDIELAYSRLPFKVDGVKTAEWIFLPNNNRKSLVFGLGLHAAGAYDVLTYLHGVESIQNSFNNSQDFE
jgi:hypothetical protein